MENFTALFPGFVSSCTTLHDALVPFALAVLVLSFGFFFWHTQHHPMEIFRFVIFLFLICLLITHTDTLINQAQSIIQNFVDTHIPARPDNIAERYKTMLSQILNTPDLQKKSFVKMLFSANFFEAIVMAVMTLISWLAMVELFFIFIIQKVALFICYALSAPLFALFTIRPLSGIALRHVLRITGLLMWNIGIATASCVTEGLIDLQIRNSQFLGSTLPVTGVAGATGWGVMQLLSLAVIAVWIIVSSIVAPLYIQRMITSSAGPAGFLPRAADLFVNLGIGSSINLARTAHAAQAAQTAAAARAASHPEIRPVPAMPTDTPAPPQTSLEKEFIGNTSENDPTAEGRVNEAINEEKQTT